MGTSKLRCESCNKWSSTLEGWHCTDDGAWLCAACWEELIEDGDTAIEEMDILNSDRPYIPGGKS